MTDEILKTLQPIFRDVLDDPELTITPETTAADVSGWDSLSHLSLVAAIEKHYRVKFALGELQKLRNVEDMIQLIVRKTS
jgi:acyl carrier protein